MSLATVWKVWGMTAREGVGMLVVGADFAPNLVAQVIGEISGFSEFGAGLPENGKGFSPGVACREWAEPDAWDDCWGCGQRLCEPRLFP